MRYRGAASRFATWDGNYCCRRASIESRIECLPEIRLAGVQHEAFQNPFDCRACSDAGNRGRHDRSSAAKPAPHGPTPPQRPRKYKIPIEQYTLKNGLRVVLSEDHAAPTVSLCITYDVGSRNELPGHTGFAHLFEHMMFQGSQNVGKGEHLILVHVNGGDVNGTTSDDSTNYYERVPANQLDMALFLESDRMRALRITQANLDNQRSTVQEERRLRMDNQAYGKTDEILEDLAYDNFAYKHSTMGSMADLNAASLDDVAQFFKTYYAPNNAVLALVGDFKSAGSARQNQEIF